VVTRLGQAGYGERLVEKCDDHAAIGPDSVESQHERNPYKEMKEPDENKPVRGHCIAKLK
jgi:hypothetical protein